MPRKKETNEEIEEEIREVVVEKKVGFNYLEVTIIMVISILFGFVIGNAVNYVKTTVTGSKAPSELKEFISTYQNLVDEYYEKLDKEALVDAAIEGMVDYLKDPYSSYIEGEASTSFNEQIDGKYIGIGTTLKWENEVASFVDIIAKGPAEKAGIQEGDVLKAVDGKEITGLSTTEISQLIKGKKGTTVKLTIQRKEEQKEVSVTREEIELSSVTAKMYEENQKKIGFIKIDIFAANTAKQFAQALRQLEKQSITSLIIDVRDNPGGHLTQVSEILSLFLNKKQVLYQTDESGIKKKVYALSKESRSYPVVVLANESSASASEILASCMKETYQAEVVGMTTYGKGTVQKSMTLKNGDTIKYTTEKWYTAKGNWIDKIGVSPTIEVEQSEAYLTTGLESDDTQLQKALEMLKEK